jgi:hypothetical protein
VYRDYINHYSKNPTVAWDKENGTADYQLLWDGLCKDGYASGLGREIEQGKGISRYTLSRYSSESRVKPVRYIQEDYLNGNRREGDLNNHIYVDVGYEDNHIRIRRGFPHLYSLKKLLNIDIKKYTNGASKHITYGLISSDNGHVSKTTSISTSDSERDYWLLNTISYVAKYKDGSKISILKGYFDSPELRQNEIAYKNKSDKLHGIFAHENTVDPGSIFERDAGDTELYSDGLLIGSVEKPEEYKNAIKSIEKDIVDFSNNALIKRALSLTVKKEYTDRICGDNTNKKICKSLELDKELTNYINLVGNIRRNSEKLKSNVVTAFNENVIKYAKESMFEPNFLADLASSYVTLRRINKMQSNIIKAKREEVRRSGLSTSQIKLSDNDIRLGGNSSGLKKYYQDGGFGGFNNKSNKPNLNYYCNTYADDYVCNPSLMKKRYLGSSGSRYRYDLSNPFDRSIYSTDVGAQINDTFSSDRLLDQGQGQFGGGID